MGGYSWLYEGVGVLYIKLCYQLIFVCRDVTVSKIILDIKLIWSFSRLYMVMFCELCMLNLYLILSLWLIGKISIEIIVNVRMIVVVFD